MYTANIQYRSPSGKSSEARIRLFAGSPDTDANLFVVFKGSSAVPTSAYDNVLFKAVASPEDMIRLTAAERYTGYYRTDRITLFFPDETTMTPIVTTLLQDVTKAVTAFRAYKEYTGVTAIGYTCVNAPVYGDLS